KRSFQILKAFNVAARAFESYGATVTIRRMHSMYWKEQRLIWLCEHGIFAHRHRADGVAVKAVMQCNELVPIWFSSVLPVLNCHLDGDFNRGRAVVGIKNSSQSRRQDSR